MAYAQAGRRQHDEGSFRLAVVRGGRQNLSGIFRKAGWAFVLGYAVSAMLQAFVPKKRLTEHMGAADTKSVLLATVFGAASSSCSFAALAAARALVMKGPPGIN